MLGRMLATQLLVVLPVLGTIALFSQRVTHRVESPLVLLFAGLWALLWTGAVWFSLVPALSPTTPGQVEQLERSPVLWTAGAACGLLLIAAAGPTLQRPAHTFGVQQGLTIVAAIVAIAAGSLVQYTSARSLFRPRMGRANDALVAAALATRRRQHGHFRLARRVALTTVIPSALVITGVLSTRLLLWAPAPWNAAHFALLGTGCVLLLVSGVLGWAVGKRFSIELTNTTGRIERLGTDSARMGSTDIVRRSRFRAVRELGSSIERLAERFRVFADAHEKALLERETAQRMRALLFAGVSHDLKSPLNSILGFAELIAREPLTPSQRESLAVIQRSGHELLMLLDSILDSARVEAGQLKLVLRPVDMGALMQEAIVQAHDLAAETPTPVELFVEDPLPPVRVDSTYLTRSIALFVAHAMRVTASDTRASPVTLRVTVRTGILRIDTHLGTARTSSEELRGLLFRPLSARGRGLTLGLSVARAIIEHHGGQVELKELPDRRPLVRATFPAP